MKLFFSLIIFCFLSSGLYSFDLNQFNGRFTLIADTRQNEWCAFKDSQIEVSSDAGMNSITVYFEKSKWDFENINGDIKEGNLYYDWSIEIIGYGNKVSKTQRMYAGHKLLDYPKANITFFEKRNLIGNFTNSIEINNKILIVKEVDKDYEKLFGFLFPVVVRYNKSICLFEKLE